MPIDKKELLAALKDQSIMGWFRNFLIQTASSETIGRYPGNGSAQDDQYVYPDDADATFPYNFDYIMPSNFQRLISAKLSFKIRAYRTYNNFSVGGGNTGPGSPHHHFIGSHGHTWHIAGGGAVATLGTNVGGSVLDTANGPFDIPTTNANLANTGDENGHVHFMNLAGSSTLGITEDVAPANPGLTVKVDGADVTSKIGGPFDVDQVEIDVTQVVATSVKLWHTLSLQPNQRVRITGILRLSYYVDARLAQ
jgi:hypothetical protein